jgi:PKD repeat protein
VILTSLSPVNDCRDSFSIVITVHPFIQANFTIPDQLGCNPFDVTIFNSSVHASIFRWDFGDGTDTVTYTTDPVIHRYINADFTNQKNFEITLVAENSAGCSSEMKRTITVEPDVIAGFNASVTEGCHPLEVSFGNLSNGGYTYSWDFGDGSTTSTDSPSHTFTNFTDSIIIRQVRLVATSRFNCTSEVTREITIHPKPKARFETDEIINCPPFDVLIGNTSLNADHYMWNFGDGDI